MVMVKRLIGFFVVAILLITFHMQGQNDFSPIQGYSKMILVTDSQIPNKENFIKNGNDFYYLFENDDVNVDFATAKGLVFYYNANFTLDYFKNHLSYLMRGGDVVGYQCYYGFAADYNDYRLVNGKKINVQLVFTGDEWLLGFPLILTGF